MDERRSSAHGRNPEDKSAGELISDMTAQVTALLRKEVDMAVIELRDALKQAAKAGGMLSGAAMSGYFSLLFGSFTVAWFVDRNMPRPLAFGLVALTHGALAASLLKLGHEEMKQVDPVPTQTVETLKENVEWAKARRAEPGQKIGAGLARAPYRRGMRVVFRKTKRDLCHWEAFPPKRDRPRVWAAPRVAGFHTTCCSCLSNER